MPLQIQEIQELVKRVAMVTKKHDCVYCGTNTWTPIDDIVEVMMCVHVGGNNFKPNNRVVPGFCLICNNCGYMRMHSLKSLGKVPTVTNVPQVNQPQDKPGGPEMISYLNFRCNDCKHQSGMLVTPRCMKDGVDVCPKCGGKDIWFQGKDLQHQNVSDPTDEKDGDVDDTKEGDGDININP